MQRAYEFAPSGALWIDGELSSFRVVKDGKSIAVIDHPTTTIIAEATNERELKGELDLFFDWKRIKEPALPLFHELDGEDDLFSDD